VNRKALGKGLGALIPEADESGLSGIRELPVDLIERNPEQPRTRFDQTALEELASSLARHGVLQPIVVRKSAGGAFRLVVGERRLRAAKLAGLATIPAVVREVNETGALEIALVENLQREDLNPIDEARGYEALVEVSGVTQSDVADRVGRDRSTVANAIRLLDLPEDVQEMLSAGTLTAGHGRALLGANGREAQLALARRAVSRGLSVREVEALARGPRPKRRTARTRRTGDAVTREWEERLQRVLGTQVRIDKMGSEGTIRIEYYSQEDLERILDLLVAAGQRLEGTAGIGDAVTKTAGE
jgi:ParB family chromosome partitioning protein